MLWFKNTHILIKMFAECIKRLKIHCIASEKIGYQVKACVFYDKKSLTLSVKRLGYVTRVSKVCSTTRNNNLSSI
jgi:hypothetical protein